MIEQEFIGKTVEAAVEEGLKTLNLSKEEAEITVLEEGKKGLFKSVPAKVSIRKKMTDGERAVEFLDKVFEILNIPVTNELTEDEENTKINVITTSSYSVIGHRGEILDSLQILAGAVANIGREDYKRVKKMDRQQFESFCKNLYMTAYEEGRKSVPGIDITEVQKAISETPGIGSKRLQSIMDSLNSKFGEEKSDEGN